MEKLQDDIMSYRDFQWAPTISKDTSNISSSLEEWLEELKKVWLLYSFVEWYGPQFTESGKSLHSEPMEDGHSNLEFLTSFLLYSHQVGPYMIVKTMDWKEVSMMVFYLALYGAENSSTSVKLQCASYLLQNYCQRQEVFGSFSSTMNEIVNHVIQCMEEREDWDAFDSLYRILHDFPTCPLFSPLILERLHRFRQTASSRPSRPIRRMYDADLYAPNTVVSGETMAVYNIDEIRNQLDIRTRNEETIQEEEDRTTTVIRQISTVYTDSQNVHHHAINESVKKNVRILYDEFHDRYTPREAFSAIQQYFEEKKWWTPVMEEVLTRIYSDPYLIIQTPFIYARDVLRCVWGFIQSQQSFPTVYDQLLLRLQQELSDAHRTCFSGHVSRLINTVVGFHPTIHISISNHDQLCIYLRNVVYAMLQETMEKEPVLGDKIIQDITLSSFPNNTFRMWTLKHRNEIITRLKENGPTGGGEEEEIREEDMETAWNSIFPEFSGLFTLSKWEKWRRIWKERISRRWKKMSETTCLRSQGCWRSVFV
uniref:Uncharacterized protein n=1 Tax=viral metagenome TaxID=1070528 RepID=A0A6C0D329_9ZZZZ